MKIKLGAGTFSAAEKERDPCYASLSSTDYGRLLPSVGKIDSLEFSRTHHKHLIYKASGSGMVIFSVSFNPKVSEKLTLEGIDKQRPPKNQRLALGHTDCVAFRLSSSAGLCKGD
jgi:hypothetical protein